MTGREPRRMVIAALSIAISAVLAAGTAALAAPHRTAPKYGDVSVTGVAAGVRTGGVVGASGGLATLDSASAYVTAHLDSAPSSTVLADPYEPGTLARTAVGQANGAAGKSVVSVPDAEADYPGKQTSGQLHTAPKQQDGPVTSQGGSASASAHRNTATGDATGSSTSVKGGPDTGASTSHVALTTARAAATATARSTVHDFNAAALHIGSVRATASLTASGSRHVPHATLTVDGATVAGQPVAIDNEGVHATGKSLLPGSTAAQRTKQLNAVLKAAGIRVHTLGATLRHDRHSATADTGGVLVETSTPDLPGGVAGNKASYVLGDVTLTESDQPPLRTTVPKSSVPGPGTKRGGAGTGSTGGSVPGTASVGGGGPVSGGSSPTVAGAPAPASGQGYALAARQRPHHWSLLVLALFEALTLNAVTLYALNGRRRRRWLAEVLD